MTDTIKVLLVDRDPGFLKQTAEFLQSQGMDVVTARTAIDASGMVTYDHPDVIVTEIELENRDSGFELTRRVKGNANTHHIPILILTGLKTRTGVEFSQEKDGYWMKADDLAEKPLANEELLQKIKDILTVNRSRE